MALFWKTGAPYPKGNVLGAFFQNGPKGHCFLSEVTLLLLYRLFQGLELRNDYKYISTVI